MLEQAVSLAETNKQRDGQSENETQVIALATYTCSLCELNQVIF